MKLILNTRFLKYFLVSFLIIEGLTLLSFLSNYIDDINGKGLPFVVIFQLCFYTFIVFLGISVLFGILMASIFVFKYFSGKPPFSFKKNLSGGLIIMFLIAILYLGFNNWILPKANLETLSLLYDITNTFPDSTFKRTDKSLFKNNFGTMTIKEIHLKIDTLNKDIKNYKFKCDSVLALLPDSQAHEIYKSSSLDKYGVGFKSLAKKDTLPKAEAYVTVSFLRLYEHNLKDCTERKQKYVREKTNRLLLPVELIILFIIGASFGYYYNDQKSFLLIILGLYTTSFFYGTNYGFEKKISQNIFDNTTGTVISLFILLIITMVFLIKSIRKENKTAQTDNFV